MTVRVDIPGANTYPTFKERCLACGHEFEITGTYEDSDGAVCPVCLGSDVKELYLSLPENGPGFQSDYAEQSDRLRGGCGSSCDDDSDLWACTQASCEQGVAHAKGSGEGLYSGSIRAQGGLRDAFPAGPLLSDPIKERAHGCRVPQRSSDSKE